MTKSGKHCGKRRNCSFWAISSIVNYVFKKLSAAEASESVFMRERANRIISAWEQFQENIVNFKVNYKVNLAVCVRFLNPFPHIDTFWHLCSRRLSENIVTKEEISQNEQFLLLPPCFPLLIIGYPFNYRDFLCFDKICSKSSAAELSYEGKG